MLEGTIRTRPSVWFAAGVVATLIIGIVGLQAWRVGASDEQPSSLVPIEACRLIDTRVGEDRVGTTGSFGPEETETLTAVGDNGQCTGIPDEATGLSMNVTALNATEPTFLTIWPGGDLPKASSLNPAPGQPPVPNAVTTPLSSDGTFAIFNNGGSVDVIVDVNGYYLPAGPSAFEVVSISERIALSGSGNTSGQSIDCPDGKRVTGGGASVIPSNLTGQGSIELQSSIPQPDLGGWSARVRATTNGASGTLNIYAVCAAGVDVAP